MDYFELTPENRLLGDGLDSQGCEERKVLNNETERG